MQDNTTWLENDNQWMRNSLPGLLCQPCLCVPGGLFACLPPSAAAGSSCSYACSSCSRAVVIVGFMPSSLRHYRAIIVGLLFEASEFGVSFGSLPRLLTEVCAWERSGKIFWLVEAKILNHNNKKGRNKKQQKKKIKCEGFTIHLLLTKNK